MKLKVPHTYVLLFVVIVICAVLTYFVPAGSFERVKDINTGRTIIDAESFKYLEQSPIGPFDIFNSVHSGMVKAAQIIFFIFILGGSFTIIQGTGVIDAGISRVVSKFSGKKEWLLIIIMFIMSVAGGTLGLAEEVLVFIPIAIALCKRLGYDKMVGLVIVTVGSRVGFTTGLMNPFTVGVAQGIAELPLFSGLGYRLIWYVVILLATIFYTIKYARKVEKNSTDSIVYGDNTNDKNDDLVKLTDFSKIHAAVLFTTVIGFGVMFYGILKYEWYIKEISGIFLLIGIVSGLIGRLTPDEIAKYFVEGAKELVFGALVVGLANAILVVMEDGKIIDTIIYSASVLLRTMPKIIAVNGMYIFQLLLNILIPSGSGQAAATIPIMAPLSDMIGITRQTAVLAFHYGDGFTNLISPTNGTLMAGLAIAGIPFDKWAKWMMPLLWFWIVVGAISVSIAALIGLGPF